MGRFSAISFITLSSSPFSKATRSVKLSMKSISPRIARSVISRTWSPTPARSANSSIHSVCINVESISKQIKRRIRRYILSSWKEKSISRSLLSFINACCISSRWWGVPRTENSIQARTFAFRSSNGIRPVRRLIASIFKPCSANIPVTAAICLAVSLRPSKVRMYRFLPCIFTHSSYSSTVTG